MKKILLTGILLYLFFSVAGLNPRVEYLESAFVENSPSVPLSEVGRIRNREEAEFLNNIIEDIIDYSFPPDFEDNIDFYIDIEDDPEFKEYLKQIKATLENESEVDNRSVPGFLQRLTRWRVIRGNPRLFRYFHRVMLRIHRTTPDIVESTPAYMQENFTLLTNLSFVSEEELIIRDEIPEYRFNSLFSLGNREYGKLATPSAMPDSTHINSKRFSTVLNQLSNFRTKTHIYNPVEVFNGREYIRANTQFELIQALKENPEYEVKLFEARAGNDYVGLYIKEDNSFTSVEIPTFVKTFVGRESVYFPANHGEYLLAVYPTGENIPLAVSKWYTGLPGDADIKQATIWQPAHYSKASWQGYKITAEYSCIEVFEVFLNITTSLQKLFNYLQNRHDFPVNGYGVLAVCNDSISLVRAFLGENPATGLFPNLRAVALDKQYFNLLHRDSTALVARDDGLLTIPSDPYFSSNYERDIRNNSAQRLSLNFPFRSKHDISGYTYRSIYEELNKIINGFDTRIGGQL